MQSKDLSCFMINRIFIKIILYKEMLTLCEKWKNNPLKNPENGGRIVKGGRIYEKYRTECEKLGIQLPAEAAAPSVPAPSVVAAPAPVVTAPSVVAAPAPSAATDEITAADCDKWRREPLKNPRTGRTITAGGP